MQDDPVATQLPNELARLLDGTDLDTKTRSAIQVASTDAQGWVRQALLSAGEILAVDESHLRLLMYATSRTTDALTQSGQGLLTAVVDGQLFRLYLRAERLSTTGLDNTAQAIFSATVLTVERDDVGYARILNGIEYQLTDETQAVRRWERQLELLREVPT